jgi:hypothetical protein
MLTPLWLCLAAGGAVAQTLMPDTIAAPTDTMIAKFHAEGAQVYECKADSAGKLAWVFREPIATLLADGRVLISGGENQSGSVFTPRLSAQLYDPTTGTSTATGSMKSRAAFAPGFLLADGTVLVVGGRGLADRYDPRTGTWLATGGPALAGASSSYPGPDFAATLLANGMVLVAGGLDDSGRLASAELYDPGAGS